MAEDKQKLAILISSAGRRVEFINCAYQAAAELNCDLTVLAADLRPAWSSACQRADRSFTVPRCDDPNFIPTLLDLCQQHKVSLLIPTIDPELAPFAAAREQFAALGASIPVSSPEVIALARNKLESNRFFLRHNIGAPKCCLLRDVLAEPSSWQFPLVAKPISGSSSIGLHIVPSLDALRALALNPDQYVVQELIRGTEYTVNLFFDRERLRCAVHHRRVEMRGGEVSKGVTERVPALQKIAEAIGSALAGKAFGALNFQVIIPSDGQPRVLEINARFSGGYPLIHRAGAPFLKWLLEPLLNRPSSINNSWQEAIAMLRYDAAFFLSGANPP